MPHGKICYLEIPANRAEDSAEFYWTGGRIGQSGCRSMRKNRQVRAFAHSGGRSLLQQLLQAIQVALNEIGIGVVVFVCDAWLAKECEKQLAAASIGDQSHRDIDR